jgi:hypothetical protein
MDIIHYFFCHTSHYHKYTATPTTPIDNHHPALRAFAPLPSGGGGPGGGPSGGGPGGGGPGGGGGGISNTVQLYTSALMGIWNPEFSAEAPCPSAKSVPLSPTKNGIDERVALVMLSMLEHSPGGPYEDHRWCCHTSKSQRRNKSDSFPSRAMEYWYSTRTSYP